jgi:hypothetical protein
MKHEYLVEATKSPTYWNSRTIEHPYLVIGAILKLHAPITVTDLEDGEGNIFTADFCTYCDPVLYPCKTIEVLKAELNG